jgi:EAL domain-containing protein (putative c-di-GMP-specific phosphodiesterase class I)
MYRAKDRGKSRYEMFDDAMRQRAIERLRTENSLHRAIERGELRVHYQPMVELATGLVVGVEALVRWQHPERGLMLPAQFIPLAEETGQIVELGEWVLREACMQHRRWMGEYADGEPLRMSVNLSARQLAQPECAADVASALEDTGMAAADLCLEITESVVVQDTEMAIVALEALRAQGVQIGIDDFGTGYASLTLLKRIPADLLKVDRSFVSGMGTDRQDTPIVRSVVGLAEALGLAAVAEGVETLEQLTELNGVECRYAQGFHFARPMPPEQLGEILAAGRRL